MISLDEIPILEQDWNKKIILSGDQRKRLEVIHKPISEVKKEASKQRSAKIKKRKELDDLKQLIELRKTCFNTLTNAKEKSDYNRETISKRKRLEEVEKRRKMLKTVREIQPKPLQFVYNYDTQELLFNFQFAEFSDNMNELPL